MPYCMFFHKGFALHGSDDIPGYRASHGCVRMFTRDAKWLNEEFVEISSERNNFLGTKVVVRPVLSSGHPINLSQTGSSSAPQKAKSTVSQTNTWKDPDLFPATITEKTR